MTQLGQVQRTRDFAIPKKKEYNTTIKIRILCAFCASEIRPPLNNEENRHDIITTQKTRLISERDTFYIEM